MKKSCLASAVLAMCSLSFSGTLPATVHEKSKRARTVRMIRHLRSLGYRVEPLTAQLNPA